MKRATNFLFAIVLAIGTVGSCFAQANPAGCPVSYSRLEMPLRHQGGMSTPLVQLSFTNETKRKIDRAKFGLLVMDPDGVQQPYSKGLTFTAGADPGKVASAEWALDLDKINIEHIGETVYLTSIVFADGTSWKDDGSERCRNENYFGPK